MRTIFAIRREDLSKKAEKRTAIVPELASQITNSNFTLKVQPAIHPEKGEIKRVFEDVEYQQVGASIDENIAEANVIFGLKEIDLEFILPDKTYFMFSHTHKGQEKNRKLLRKLIEKNCSLIDYELIVDEDKQRIVTAFTYFAGYAGMIDSLWTLGKRLKNAGIRNVFEQIPQSIEKENLNEIKAIVQDTGAQILQKGTSPDMPPVITCFLGNGKTSTGAQEIYDLLPTQTISLAELPQIFENGSRNWVYKLVLDIPDMYRLHNRSAYADKELSYDELFDLYLKEPGQFESNLDEIFPYCTVLMNCILWSPKFPRLLSLEDAKHWYQESKSLQVVGDITCDPEGAIQFSQETWIDDPVFIFNPQTGNSKQGFEGEGIAVMAVTNLPCEFSADASRGFSENLAPLLSDLLSADFSASNVEEAHLPDAIRRATILWKGQFTPEFVYMNAFV